MNSKNLHSRYVPFAPDNFCVRVYRSPCNSYNNEIANVKGA